MKPLPTPLQLQTQHALIPSAVKALTKHRREIADILQGKDGRLLVISGPCSLDASGAALKYAQELTEVTKNIPGVKVVVRMPPLKPRTTSGWRGVEQDSMALARKLLVEVANQRIPVAIELLGMHQPSYYHDVLSLAWVGARNVVDQNVRLAASNLAGIPMLAKNGLRGDMSLPAQALQVAGNSQQHVPLISPDGQLAVANTPGAIAGGTILRGTATATGQARHNITADALAAAKAALESAGMQQLGVVIDTSHSNAAGHDKTGNKSVPGQLTAAAAAAQLLLDDDDHTIRGVMCESYLHRGTISDAVEGSEAGYSHTDPCLSLGQTVEVIGQLARAQQRRLLHYV